MPISHTAQNQGYYSVYINTPLRVLVSRHIAEREALEVATNLAEENPGDTITTEHDYIVRTVYSEPIVEIFEGIPTFIPAYAVPDWYEDLLTDPGSSWRASGTGAPPNTVYDSSFFQIGSTRLDPLTHFTDGVDGSGYIRATIASTATETQSQMNFNINQLWQAMWFRGVRRGVFTLGSPATSEDMVGKFMYHNTTCQKMRIDHTTMSGHQSGTVTGGDLVYNVSTGFYTGTITTGLGSIARGTAFIFTDGAAWALPGALCLNSYDSATGAVSFFARPWGAQKTQVPTNGANFKVFAQCGESVTFSGGGSGNISHISINTPAAPYSLLCGILNETGFPLTDELAGTLTFAGGITVDAVIDSVGQNARADFQSTNSTGSVGAPESEFPDNNQTLNWFPHTQGGFFDVVTQIPASPYNLADNNLPFVTLDHGNEWFEIKFMFDPSANPWVMRVFITNQDAIEVHGVTEGQAETILGVNHFNNCEYMHFEFPNPAITTNGWNMEWGSYISNSCWQHAGEHQDISFVEQFDGINGGVDPFNTPFVRNSRP